MRLTGELREQATRELLSILAKRPGTTRELQGTRHFHGELTLSLKQIRTLLRKSGQVTETPHSCGPCRTILWKLKEEPMFIDIESPEPYDDESPWIEISEFEMDEEQWHQMLIKIRRETDEMLRSRKRKQVKTILQNDPRPSGSGVDRE